ncbi:hypothetical protein SAMN02800691_0028 [Luteibacter sp. UNCMF366Tsu5.1]|nr:hypothetical protein SAMN02800691_0028 [Luteibacter sp. UNCMF366Tsu5.1]
MAKQRSYWFGRKRVGWGIGPTSWQGWAIMAAYTALMIASTKVGFLVAHPMWEGVLAVSLTFALFAVMFVTYDRSERL